MRVSLTISWPISSALSLVLGLRELGDVIVGVLERDKLAPARQRDRIIKPSLPAAISHPVPVVNQVRTYWCCSPPRTGRQRMLPTRSTARETRRVLLQG